MSITRYQRYLSFAVFMYIVFFSVYSILRHYIYITASYDLGIFMQSLWTTAHGMGFLFNTPEWEDLGTYSHFGVHNSPILLLLVPVYRVIPRAEFLLILQTIALGMGAFTLFKFAKATIGEKKAFYISLMYLANPLIQGINRYDFHPVSLVVPFIFLIPYYYERAEYLKMILMASLVLTAKEDAGLILISLGALFMVKKYGLKNTISPTHLLSKIKDSRWELLLILLGVVWIAISVFLVIPKFNGGSYPYLTNSRVQRYSFSDFHLGRDVAFVAITLLTMAFIPILKGEYFITSMLLWLELLSPAKTTNMVTIGFQYPYMLAPFLFIISVYTLKEAGGVIKKRVTITIRKAALIAMVSMILFSPAFHVLNVPYTSGTTIYKLVTVKKKWDPYFDVLDEVTAMVSNSSCPVSTQNLLFPHLANRNNTYCLITLFNAQYLPNNSIVLLAPALPDYPLTLRALENSTLTANKTYFILNVNKLIMRCYNQTRNNTKKFKECIVSSTQAIIQKCEWERHDEK